MSRKNTQKNNQPYSKKPVSQGVKQPDNKWKYLPWIALIATFVVYIPSLFNDFVTNWDDGGYLVTDDAIKSLSFDNLKIIFTRYYKGNYHPLTTLFYAVEYSLVSLKPFLYHLNNLILHLLNVWLVYKLVDILSKRIEIAFITAILFGIHPMHVESVAWISERKDVMYAFFFLLSIIYYIRYFERPEKKDQNYVVSLVFFALSLLSKSAAVCLPVVLVLIDFFYRNKMNAKVAVEKIAFFALAIIFGVVAIKSQGEAGAIQDLNPIFSLFDRFFLASYAVMMYLYMMILPIGMSTMHPYPQVVAGALPTIYYVAPIVVIALIAVVLISLRKTKVVLFGVAFFIVTIALVLQILPVGGAIIAERYTYIPYIGLFYIIGYLYTLVLEKSKANGTLFRYALIAFAVIMCVVTVKRIAVWKRGDALFADVTEVYPQMPFGYNNLGYFYYTKLTNPEKPQNPYKNFKGEMVGFEYVIGLYNKCLSLDPNFHMAYSNRGVLYFNTGKPDLALSDFTKALKFKSTNKDALIGRANTLSSLGRFAESIPDYEKYLKDVEPKDDKAMQWLGVARYRIGKYDEAIADFDKAAQTNPKNSQAFYWRGLSFYQKKLWDKALVDFDASIAIDPNNPEPYTWKAFTNYNQKKYEEAAKAFSMVINIKPNDVFARKFRGNSYMSLKKFNDAIMDYSVVIQGNPQEFEALEARAHAYYETKQFNQAFADMEAVRMLGKLRDVPFYSMLKNRSKK